ncbi:hypothetical protein [Acidithiobacillus ferrianus]|uniref:hypothetical protein n=1 Tax=Acidithiobacillus ferrianus TaxID=2678518 RepID=UPI0034E5CFE7
MKIDSIWKAGKATKMESKNNKGTFFFLQPVTLYPFSGGPLSFDLFFQDGEKRFEDTQGGMRRGQIGLVSDRGDLKIVPASSGSPCSIKDYNDARRSGELVVVDLQAWPSEYRAAGEFDDRSWDESWIQSVTVLDDKMCPTDLTLRTYHDFQGDCLEPDVYRASFVLSSRKQNKRNYPSFKLVDVVPAVTRPQAVNA